MHVEQTEMPSTMTHAEAAARVALSSALAQIRAGKLDLAVEALERALSVLADPQGSVEGIVRDAERFREFATAAMTEDAQFEDADLNYPPRGELISPLDYFRGMVDFATAGKYGYQHQGLVS